MTEDTFGYGIAFQKLNQMRGSSYMNTILALCSGRPRIVSSGRPINYWMRYTASDGSWYVIFLMLRSRRPSNGKYPRGGEYRLFWSDIVWVES